MKRGLNAIVAITLAAWCGSLRAATFANCTGSGYLVKVDGDDLFHLTATVDQQAAGGPTHVLAVAVTYQRISVQLFFKGEGFTLDVILEGGGGDFHHPALLDVTANGQQIHAEMDCEVLPVFF